MNDTISRQAAIYAIDEQIEQCDKSLSSFDISLKDTFAVKVERASLVAFREILEYLPSAQPERIRGRWIPTDSQCGIGCSVCGYPVDNFCHSIDYIDLEYEPNFCPNCGADMRESKMDDSTV